MLMNLIYLQICYRAFVNIGFDKTDVKVAMLKAYFLIVELSIVEENLTLVEVD